MRNRCSRWGRVLVALALPLAVAVALLNPTPAFAAEMVSEEGILSQFTSGDVGRYKVAAERDAGNLKWRAVTTLWCDNSAGDPVDCGYIEASLGTTKLQKEVGGSVTTVQSRSDWLDAADVHSKRMEHAWECEGTTLGQYRATFANMRLQDRFGQWGGYKSRETNYTTNYGSC